jgi:hypothetical protein
MRFLFDLVAETRRFFTVQHLEADDCIEFERIRIKHPYIVLITHALGGNDSANQLAVCAIAEEHRQRGRLTGCREAVSRIRAAVV